MGFAWELANVTGSGGPDAGERPPSSPRHGGRPRPHVPHPHVPHPHMPHPHMPHPHMPHPHMPHPPGLAACARAAVAALAAGSRAGAAALAAGSRRVKTLICTRPALADHRRAF
jgi:hypothetical protein